MPSARLEFSLTGLDKMLSRLDKLDKKIKRTTLTKAIRAACKPIIKAARSKVRKRTGLLKKGLGVKLWRKGMGSGIMGIIGPRRGVGKTVDGKEVMPVKYAHLVEFGTSKAPAHPFLRPALNQQRSVATAAMVVVLKQAIASA